MTRELVKVEGFKELDEALTELPKSTGKTVARRALLAAGEPIAEAARQNVPVLSGRLKASIVVSTRLAHKAGASEYRAALQSGQGQAAAVQAMRDARRAGGGSSAVEVHIGTGQLPHAHLIEFGSSHNAPHPYLRPAFDANWRGALESIKGHLAREIERARARLARKAARIASKSGG